MPKAKKQDRITHISRVVFEGYKSIDHLEIDLVKGLNILIGPNGSGKSNFLNLLDAAFNIYPPLKPRIQPTIENYTLSKIAMVTSNNKNIDWYTERNDANDKFWESVGENIPYYVPDKGYYSNEKLIIDKHKVFDSKFLKDDLIKLKNGRRIDFKYVHALPLILVDFNLEYPSIVFVRYNLPDNLMVINVPGRIEIDKKSKSTSVILYSTLMINSLFTVFDSNYLLKSIWHWENKLDKSEILKGLVIPDFIKWNLRKFSPIQDVRFSPNINPYEDENRISIENIFLEFYVNDTWMPWSYLSDGTKRLFYLISEISYFESAIILIEEPELGVHPEQFNSIMNFLKEQAESKQIIMSTHSPEALNILNENELQNIIITKYDKKKGTTMSHLGKQQIAKAKAYMKELDLSDYWLSSDLEA